MLESIVLLWIVMQMQAPLWVYIVVVLMLFISALSWVISVLEKVEEKRLAKAKKEAENAMERLDRYKAYIDQLERETSGKE